MDSPFRRRQQIVRGLMSGASVRAAANKPAAPAPAPDPETPAGQEYANLRVLLHDNLRALSDIASHEARNPKKAEFAKAFAPWIEGVLKADAADATQDEILVTNMIWAVDYRDVDYALQLGSYAVRHHLTLPESYSRSPACFLAEDIAHLALSNPDAVTLDQLTRLRTLVEGSDMPDPVTARLAKAIGRAFVAKADAFDPAADNAPAGGKAAYQAEALANFQRALQLDAQAGVKKDIEAMQRALKDAGVPQEAAPVSTATPTPVPTPAPSPAPSPAASSPKEPARAKTKPATKAKAPAKANARSATKANAPRAGNS